MAAELLSPSAAQPTECSERQQIGYDKRIWNELVRSSGSKSRENGVSNSLDTNGGIDGDAEGMIAEVPWSHCKPVIELAVVTRSGKDDDSVRRVGRIRGGVAKKDELRDLTMRSPCPPGQYKDDATQAGDQPRDPRAVPTFQGPPWGSPERHHKGNLSEDGMLSSGSFQRLRIFRGGEILILRHEGWQRGGAAGWIRGWQPFITGGREPRRASGSTAANFLGKA